MKNSASLGRQVLEAIDVLPHLGRKLPPRTHEIQHDGKKIGIAVDEDLREIGPGTLGAGPSSL